MHADVNVIEVVSKSGKVEFAYGHRFTIKCTMAHLNMFQTYLLMNRMRVNYFVELRYVLIEI